MVESDPARSPDDNMGTLIPPVGSSKILQVLIEPGSKLVESFTEQLLKRIGVNQYDVTVKILTKAEDVLRDETLLVICYNHSRIGTDIDSATHGVEAVDWNKVALVAFHVMQDHVLPVLMPTDCLYDNNYSRFGILADYAYYNQKIYSCEMNTIGDDRMKSYMKQHFKRRYVCGRASKGFVTSVVTVTVVIVCGAFAFYVVCGFSYVSDHLCHISW